MIILHVSGDDYAAMHFEQNFNPKKVYEDMVIENKTFTYFESDEYYIDVKIRRFGDVDPAFIDFLHDQLIDYDASKHEDFFIVE